MDDKPIDVMSPFPQDASDQLSNSIPHTIQLRPSQLRRERIIFACSIAIPFMGFVVALGLALNSGVRPLDLTCLGSMFLVTVLGIEVGYHRLFSHHAFATVQPVRIFLAIAGCMALQGPIVYWASNHRRHHAFSDQPQDPHSPQQYRQQYGHGISAQLKGFWHAHIGWIFSDERTCPGRYGRDLLVDPVIRVIDRFYLLWVGLGLILPAIIGGLVGGNVGCLHGFLWGGLVRIFLVQQGTYSINSCCHLFGDRPFETQEKSTNNSWLALLTLGGALHNTHHAFPHTAVNGFRWWHMDISGWFILTLAKLGFAWDVKKPTAQMIAAKQKKCFADSVDLTVQENPTVQGASHVQ